MGSVNNNDSDDTLGNVNVTADFDGVDTGLSNNLGAITDASPNDDTGGNAINTRRGGRKRSPAGRFPPATR